MYDFTFNFSPLFFFKTYSFRLDKLNIERLNDHTEVQAKLAMVGKSASRHIDGLKRYVLKECQSLFDLATKPCSVVFNAFR